MNVSLIKMEENRVRRNYKGGKILDQIRGKFPALDGERPEEWICSLVEANNPGLSSINREGLSCASTAGEGRIYMRELFAKNPGFYLGKFADAGFDMGFLTKWIDSSIRLHVQAHPTKDFSMEKLGLPYGKFECYYILAAREGIDPYIRLGFQHAPDKDEWKEIIATQNLNRMDRCFDKIHVRPGDMVYIPGGVPHAIGEGLLLLEVMEPSDLVVRCEFEREGIVVPEEARFMGKDLDFCLDIFDYEEYSQEEIRSRFFLCPILLHSTAAYTMELMLDARPSGSFEVVRVQVRQPSEIPLDQRFLVGVCCKGNAVVRCQNSEINLNVLDSFFLAAESRHIVVTPGEGDSCELCFILPSLVL